MEKKIEGLHHITAIASDPQTNLDFYQDVLGLRLVKRTINFDDPGTYHLYYGDEIGRPGTIMTFFPWMGMRRGRQGNGQATVTAFSIPAEAVGYWKDRLPQYGVEVEQVSTRFNEEVLSLRDPDGMKLELVAHADAEEGYRWDKGSVPTSYAIRGFRGITLELEGFEKTNALLTKTMGYRRIQEEGSRFRYQGGNGVPGNILDVHWLPTGLQGTLGAGTIHHIAFRTPDDAQQEDWLATLTDLGYHVSQVMERQYFRSIYFREPGGVLFEIATDKPGFTLDEAPEHLGEGLKLPSWLEKSRAKIEEILPPLNLTRVKEGVNA